MITKPTDEKDVYQSLRSILMGLHSSNYEAHKDRNPRAVQGTCTWIFKQEKYRSWLEEEGPSLLWISADPGCGKSVLTSFLIGHHRRTSAVANICYFFFKADSIEQGEAVYGLSAMLHQLYTLQPGLIEVAQKQLQIPGQNLKSLSTLWKIFVDSVDHREARPTLCFLDGLDECEELSRKQLVSVVSKYFTAFDELQNEQRKLKVLVTSRPENSIKAAFDRHQEVNVSDKSKSKERFTMMRLRGENETNAISADIELVVRDAIGDLVGRGLPQELLADMAQELITRADRTFLWTTLIIGLVKEKAEEGASRRELDSILESRGVDAIYSALLNSKTNHAKARKLLSIVLAALEPLTVEELSIALAIHPDHRTFEQSSGPRRPSTRTFHHIDRDLVYPFENHFKSLCGHFIRIIHGKVYLVHQTAREFLLDKASRELLDDPSTISVDQGDDMWSMDDDSMTELTDGNLLDHLSDSEEAIEKSLALPECPWQNSFSLVDAHALMLEICVTYLYLLGKKSPKSQLGTPSSKMSAFLQYAARSWLIHFHKVHDKVPLTDLPYYQGLCHPRFPGFTTWLSIYGGPEILHVVGRSDDEQQDELVKLFGLEPGEYGSGRQWYKNIDMPSVQYVPLHRASILSSNPGASENFHFPVKANDTGFVSLDFDRVQAIFNPNH